MYSTIDVCFMCIKDKNCIDANKNILSLVEYILPEITIIKLEINLRICSVCEETICLFSKFKGVCVENSLLLETSIKEAQAYCNNTQEDKSVTSNNQPVEKNNLKPKTQRTTPNNGKNLEKDDSTDTDEDVENLEEISTDETTDDNCFIDESHIKNSKTLKKVYCCRICKKVFKNKNNMKTHSSTHRFERKCPICNKEFTTKYSVKDHILAVHKKIRNYQCVVCGKRFSHKPHMDLHLKNTHTVHIETKKIATVPLITGGNKMENSIERKYKCSKCSRSYSRIFSLEFHLKQHEQHSKLICVVCNQPFGHNRHTEGHAEFEHIPRIQVKRQECRICNKMFAAKYLKDHQRIHKKEKEFKCKKCHRLFAQKTALVKHVKLVHEGMRMQCVKCNGLFSYKYRLKDHLSKTHNITLIEKSNDLLNDENSVYRYVYTFMK